MSCTSSDCESCYEPRIYESPNSDDYDSDSAEFIHPNPNTFDSPQRQNFSLPNVLIHYILMNPKSAKGLKKLQKTCKYFFAKNKIVVVDEKVAAEKDHIYCYGFNLYFNVPIFKYWLAKKIHSFGHKSFMQSIFRCSITSLNLHGLTFTLSEFDFLLGDGKIHFLHLNGVSIFDAQDELVKFDQIMAKIPYIRKLEYFCDNEEIFSTETFENLCSMKFNCKLKHFILFIYNLSNKADITPFCKYFQNNAARGTFTYIKVQFKIKNSAEILTKMQSCLESWIKKEDEKEFMVKKQGQGINLMSVYKMKKSE